MPNSPFQRQLSLTTPPTPRVRGPWCLQSALISSKDKVQSVGGLAILHCLRFRSQSHQRCNEEPQKSCRALLFLLHLVRMPRGCFESQEKSKYFYSANIYHSGEWQTAWEEPQASPSLYSRITDPLAKLFSLQPRSSCSV